MSNEPKAGRAIDPEVLAAYIDKRLPPDERAAVEAQLARDPDSYELLVELIHAKEALKADKPHGDVVTTPVARPEPQAAVVPLVPRPRRTRGWAIAAGVLAAAAALVLVVRLQPELLQRLRGGEPVDPQLAKLVAAVGEERYVEARLTGGFKYGPLRQVTRGPGDLSQQNLALLAAAGELQKEAQAEPSATSLHLWGVAQLLLGQAASSVQTLSAAADLAPASGDIQADLASALLVRSRSLSLPEDVPRALEILGRVLQTSPGHREALYNRALALESLGLREEAQAAWTAYLQVDSDSDWAVFAKTRLRTLSVGPALDEQLRTGLSAVGNVDALDGSDPQAVREYVENVLLPHLADPASQLDPAVFGSHLRITLAITKRLAELQHDPMLYRAVQDVAGDPMSTRSQNLLRGFTSLAKVRQLTREARTDDMGQAAVGCVRLFMSVNSPYAAWCQVFRARALSSIGELQQSEAIARAVADDPAVANFPTVKAWALLQIGGVRFLSSDYPEAVQLLRAASRLFEQAAEFEHAAGVHETLGATFLELGDRGNAWSSLTRALTLLPPRQQSIRWFATRTGVSLALLSSGYPQTAETILLANLSARATKAAPGRLSETHRYLAEVCGQMGRFDEAAFHLDQAQEYAREVTDPIVARRLGAEILLAQAKFTLPRNPKEAGDSAELALKEFSDLNVGPRALQLMVLKAQSEVALQRTSRARHEIAKSLEFAETLEGRVAGRQSRSVFRHAIADIYRMGIRLAIDAGGTDEALLLRERLRRRGSSVSSEQSLAQMRAQIPSLTAVIVFLVDDDRVYRWCLTQSEYQFKAYSVSESMLAREVSRFTARLRSHSGDSTSPMLTSIVLDGLPDSARSATRWIISPDGPLFSLPVAALTDGVGRRVVQDHQVLVSSSVQAFVASLLRVSLRQRPVRAVVVGDPTNEDYGLPSLPFALAESRSIADSYGVTAIEGSVATVAAFKRSLLDADILHFSGHAVSDSLRPWRAHLVLSPDLETPSGLLNQQAIESLRTRASVVVLAGCSTASSEELQGEGLGSLAGSFVHAGARAVVGTLWDVEDAGLGDALHRLHQRLALGEPVEEALQTIQQQALREGVMGAREWAAMVVVIG